MKRTVQPAVLACLALLLATGASRAQSFNLDFGASFRSPAAGYGAAANQGGFWQTSTGGGGAPERLVDIRGVKTEVTFREVDLPFGPAGTNHPGTSGGDQALLDDYLDLHNTPARFAIEGLAPGRYAIFTYAWAPDDTSARTIVSVDGRDPQFVGGEWDGVHAFGVTYAQHAVEIESGEAVVIWTFGLGVGTLNGLQVVALP